MHIKCSNIANLAIQDFTTDSLDIPSCKKTSEWQIFLLQLSFQLLFSCLPVRISGGQADENTTAGKVEMYHHGNWVTVCADGFNDTDARLVCRELGFPNSKALVPGDII